MTDPALIADHGDQAVALLTHDFQESPMLKALLRDVFVKQVQALEEVFFSLIRERMLESAVGAQLDQYGKLIGEKRDGLSDSDYRAFIAARILTNRSSGTINTILNVVSTITRASKVRYLPHYPAAFTLQYEDPFSRTAGFKRRVKAQVLSMTPAGVGFQVVEAKVDSFGFEDDPLSKGFNEGEFASII